MYEGDNRQRKRRRDRERSEEEIGIRGEVS
jgi:hypothetical protein